MPLAVPDPIWGRADRTNMFLGQYTESHGACGFIDAAIESNRTHRWVSVQPAE